MKTKYILSIITALIISCSVIYGQDDFITLTSLQLIRGLDDRDYLAGRLTENGYNKTGGKKKMNSRSGYHEYWQYKSLLFTDVINRRGKQNFIILRIDQSFKGLSDRLLESFPYKTGNKGNLDLKGIDLTRINKKNNFALSYPRDSDVVSVCIWFDSPYYFFEYFNEKGNR